LAALRRSARRVAPQRGQPGQAGHTEPAQNPAVTRPPHNGRVSEQTAAAEPVDAEKKVDWAELFFDLVFVVAVTRVSTVVEHDHTWGGLLRALIVFVPIYWTWVGTAIQTNLNDVTRPYLRVRVFVVALCSIFMALSLPDAYGDLGLVFAVSYWVGRIVLGVGVFRAAWRAGQAPLNPFVVAMTVSGPMLVIGALCHGDVRELIWGLAALLDLSTPTILRNRLRNMHFDSGHLAERFGLFLLIALGESVVAIGTSTSFEHPGVVDILAIAAAFVLACGLWWVYFHFAADAMRYSLATARVQLDVTRLVLSYGHLSFIGAVIVVAVGLRESVAAPQHHLSWAVVALLFGGTTLYLATFGFTRWAMFRLVSWTRLTAAAAVLLLLPVARYVPALAALLGIAVVLVVLNVVELMRVERIGWRALLSRRALAP
jgi:low temperature requirement protein LtrA